MAGIEESSKNDKNSPSIIIWSALRNFLDREMVYYYRYVF